MSVQFGGIVHFIGPSPKVAEALQKKVPDHYLHKKVIHNAEALYISGKDLAHFTKKKLNVPKPETPLLGMADSGPLLEKVRKQDRISQSLFWVDVLKKENRFSNEIKKAFEQKGLNTEEQSKLYLKHFEEVKLAQKGKDAYGQDIEEISFPFPQGPNTEPLDLWPGDKAK